MSQAVVESLVKLFSLREAFHPTAFMQMIFYGQFVSLTLAIAFMLLVVVQIRSENADGLHIYKEYLHHLRKKKKVRRIISLIRPSKKVEKSAKSIKVLCQHKERQKTPPKKSEKQEATQNEPDADDFDEGDTAEVFKPSTRSLHTRKSEAVIQAPKKSKSQKEEKKKPKGKKSK